MNPEFNGIKMNRVSICSRLPLQAVLGPLRRYVASGFLLNVLFFANGGVTPIWRERQKVGGRAIRVVWRDG